jgi:large subunit ribosomal protein L10
MPRPDKVADVAELAEEFRTSEAIVLTDYRGLSVAELTELRRSLGADVSYTIVKNTLARLAAAQAGADALVESFTGPSAVAIVKGDPVEAAKSLRDFSKAHHALVLRGGLLAGRFVDAAEVAKLADLESREVLLARLAGAMKASMSQAASLFAAPLSQTARAVEALRAKVEEGAPAVATDAEPAAAETPAAEAPEAEAPEAPEAEAPEAPAAESEAASSAGSLRSTPSDTTSDSAGADASDTTSDSAGADASDTTSDSAGADASDTTSADAETTDN